MENRSNRISCMKIVLIPLLIGIVVSTYQVFIDSRIGDGPPTPTPTVNVSSAESSAADPTPVTSSSSPSPYRDSSVPILASLEDAVAIEPCRWPGVVPGYQWKRFYWLDLDGKDVKINGKMYSEGFGCQMKSNLATGYVDFEVPQGATKFTVTAGQLGMSHDTDTKVIFDILDAGNNLVMDTRTVSFAEEAEFFVPVDGVVRIRLRAIAEDPRSEVDFWAGWADPTFS